MRRFEKSLYDLIRGLRNHKGNEKEYIQKSLKECRAEVRSQDMGSSATRVGRFTVLLMHVDRLEGDSPAEAGLLGNGRP